MPTHETEIRVRYADTDQGGVVYYANYLAFFEVGRTELMRHIGLPYAELERRGIVMPVVEAHVTYHGPARYDDLLVVTSEVTEVKRVRLRIDTAVRHLASGRRLAEGWVWLASTRAGDKIVALPDDLRDALSRWNSGKSA